MCSSECELSLEVCHIVELFCDYKTSYIYIVINGWMDERCFRPLLCTVKAELGRIVINSA